MAAVHESAAVQGNGSHSKVGGRPVGLPTAPRRPRNTIWMVGGLALMLVSVVVALAVARGLSARTEVLVATRSVSAGELIEQSDIAFVGVASDQAIPVLDPSRKDDFVGMVAAGPIAEGAILSEVNFEVGADIDVITVIAGFELEPGAYPRRGLLPGDLVTIIEVSEAGFGDEVAADARTIGDGEVVEIQRLSAGDTILVSLRIPERLAEGTSQIGFEKRMRLVQKEFTDSEGTVEPLLPVEPAEAVDTDSIDSSSEAPESSGSDS